GCKEVPRVHLHRARDRLGRNNPSGRSVAPPLAGRDEHPERCPSLLSTGEKVLAGSCEGQRTLRSPPRGLPGIRRSTAPRLFVLDVRDLLSGLLRGDRPPIPRTPLRELRQPGREAGESLDGPVRV